MALLFGGKPTPLLDGLLPDHDETLAEERSRDNRNCIRTYWAEKKCPNSRNEQ